MTLLFQSGGMVFLSKGPAHNSSCYEGVSVGYEYYGRMGIMFRFNETWSDAAPVKDVKKAEDEGV
jgi:hypothetical protein